MGRKQILWAVVGTLAFVTFVLWGTHTLLVRHYPNDPQARGFYGDMFGVADAIFSGIALVGIVWALVFQGQEVNATMKELRDAAVAHKEQARLSALAALIQAADASIQEGDQSDVPFEGKAISIAELKRQCLLTLVSEYEQTEQERTGKA